MTALAMIIGMIPMALGLGEGGEQNAPLGRAVIGGLLLATNYMFVMWNRAALMESTMTALITVGWAAYAKGERRGLWGLAAGVATALALAKKLPVVTDLTLITCGSKRRVNTARPSGAPALTWSASCRFSPRRISLCSGVRLN
jgi:4-amino-4-deoxy-L-arabinose transferase-like glycosyltransferase